MLDKATVLTTLFTIVDDTMKGSVVIQQALERPEPAPQLSDSEVVSIALYQELIGEPREDHFFRLYQEQLRPFLPMLNERSRYNRRKRALWAVILAVRASLHLVQEACKWKRPLPLTRPLFPVSATNAARRRAISLVLPTMAYAPAK
ncbi:hypothetical protein KSC_017540 [Ktedonobacter sp. SOSP1-52]|uniref:hypothetical protein n=1 Tax=Ktedonobacter sp. SOSP1-52 TaxID=2778366 RepID=UPI001915A56A|nr:hypothetical protein [Ktedonobacter sp. SOSP1-52]GHO62862.1 hypothetical protein KSC_017540 [Ktedonobacter sp. SOSP1-52]